ncbi:hypothetical protein O9992_17990 [Vibrio lentus]|nr:hypothetical protein [Vibrio lentus]
MHRWGGEEFVLLLSGSQDPEQQLETIRLAIAQHPIDTHAGTLSLPVQSVPLLTSLKSKLTMVPIRSRQSR